MSRPNSWRWIPCAAALAIACGSPDEGPVDGGLEDAGFEPRADAGAADAGADAGVDAGLDSGVDGGTDGGVDAGPLEPIVYPFTLRHSPLTASVVANLKRIADAGPAQQAGWFSRIGDSNTVNTSFLSCFDGANVDLAGRVTLQPAIDHFKPAFTRVSQAAAVGWSAGAVTAGSPSALEKELAAVAPRYAVVMFGTNDIGNGTGDAFAFARAMFAITDQLIARGVVPLLTTPPPRDDAAAGEARVPEFDAVTHGIAQARQVPLIDLNRELRSVPSHGIGGDGLHLNVYAPSGLARGCVLSATGLGYGHNTRNLITLEALERARQALVLGVASDATAPVQQGKGSLTEPFVVPSLPFVDLRDTSRAGTNRISSYPGCAAAQDESGRELLYRLTVSQPTPVRIQAFAINGADIDLHLMGDPATGAGCALRGDRQLVTTLQPGTWWLSLDTFVNAGVPLAGEYLLTILPQ